MEQSTKRETRSDDPAGPSGAPTAPSVSILVPTRNEEGNVVPLVTRVANALSSTATFEIVFVDDSTDRTPDRIREVQPSRPEVRLVHRAPTERVGGLSGAVLAGASAARGDVLVVMDGDLQHPPEIVPQLVGPLLDGTADIVVATRYRPGGSSDGLDGALRRLVSTSARRFVHVLLPASRGVSDPLGGFFALRRSVTEDVALEPDGFKILLEILVRGHWEREAEVPYEFGTREHGKSKASLSEGMRFGRHVGRLVCARGARRRSTAAKPRAPVGTGTGLRVVLAMTAIVVAYFASLRSLLGAWSPAEPASVACIVPILAIPLFVAYSRRTADEPEIYDRDVDYVVGITLLCAALALLGPVRRHMGLAFWVHRADLLSLPIFVAGVAAILFGTRLAWRVRVPLLVLLLAWPPITRATATALAAGIEPVVVRSVYALASGAGSARIVPSGVFAGQAVLSVKPAVFVTAVLMLAAVLALTIGLACRTRTPRRCIAFVVASCALAFGEGMFLLASVVYALHSGDAPLARTLTSSGAVAAAALLAVAAASLLLVVAPRVRHGYAASGRIGAPLAGIRVASAVLAIGAAGAAVSTAPIGPALDLADALGRPRVTPVVATNVAVGYRLVGVGAERHSSVASSARRYVVLPDTPRGRSADDPQVDVFPTASPGAGAVRALRRAYALRAYPRVRATRIDLEHGVTAEQVTFSEVGQRQWSAITWVWPVRDDSAQFERVLVAWGDPVTATQAATRAAAAVEGRGIEPLVALARAIVATHVNDGDLR